MTPRQEKEFCEVMTDRLHWYEDVMDGSKAWHVCRICEVFDEGCKVCPLRGCNTDLRRSAIAYIRFGTGHVTDVKRHYKDLIRKIKIAGFEYE